MSTFGTKITPPGLRKYLDSFLVEASDKDLRLKLNGIVVPKPHEIEAADIMTNAPGDIFFDRRSTGVIAVSVTWLVNREDLQITLGHTWEEDS